MRKTSLYRHFDADGRLLYVGISANHFARMASHKQSAEWFGEVATITIEHFKSRASAVDAERRAINSENPKHNIQRPTLKLPKGLDLRSKCKCCSYWIINPGDDAGELTGAVARFQKALHMRRYRSK